MHSCCPFSGKRCIPKDVIFAVDLSCADIAILNQSTHLLFTELLISAPKLFRELGSRISHDLGASLRSSRVPLRDNPALVM